MAHIVQGRRPEAVKVIKGRTSLPKSQSHAGKEIPIDPNEPLIPSLARVRGIRKTSRK